MEHQLCSEGGHILAWSFVHPSLSWNISSYISRPIKPKVSRHVFEMLWPEKGNLNMLLWQAFSMQQQYRPNLFRMNLHMFHLKTFPLQFSTCNEVVKFYFIKLDTPEYSIATIRKIYNRSFSSRFTWKKWHIFRIMDQFVFAQFQRRPKSTKPVLTLGQAYCSVPASV